MDTLRLALALRQALVLSYPRGSQQLCTTANNAVHVLFPGARRHVGTFEGQPHEWAQVDDLFVDLTANQFPGGPEVVLTKSLDGRWRSTAVPWQPRSSWPADKTDEVDALVQQARSNLK